MPPAAFLRAISVFFVGHKKLEGSQQKGPEPALFRVSAIEVSPLQHPDEEVLREILGLIRGITAPAQIGVQRTPVVFTHRAARADRASFRRGSPVATTMVHRVVGN